MEEDASNIPANTEHVKVADDEEARSKTELMNHGDGDNDTGAKATDDAINIGEKAARDNDEAKEENVTPAVPEKRVEEGDAAADLPVGDSDNGANTTDYETAADDTSESTSTAWDEQRSHGSSEGTMHTALENQVSSSEGDDPEGSDGTVMDRGENYGLYDDGAVLTAFEEREDDDGGGDDTIVIEDNEENKKEKDNTAGDKEVDDAVLVPSEERPGETIGNDSEIHVSPSGVLELIENDAPLESGSDTEVEDLDVVDEEEDAFSGKETHDTASTATEQLQDDHAANSSSDAPIDYSKDMNGDATIHSDLNGSTSAGALEKPEEKHSLKSEDTIVAETSDRVNGIDDAGDDSTSKQAQAPVPIEGENGSEGLMRDQQKSQHEDSVNEKKNKKKRKSVVFEDVKGERNGSKLTSIKTNGDFKGQLQNPICASECATASTITDSYGALPHPMHGTVHIDVLLPARYTALLAHPRAIHGLLYDLKSVHVGDAQVPLQLSSKPSCMVTICIVLPSKTTPDYRASANEEVHLWIPPPRDHLSRRMEGMGRAITIVIGGARESLDAQPYTMKLVLKCRKGFVKMGIRCGADLVPVLAFGENDLYDQYQVDEHPYIHKFQMLVKKFLGFTVPLFHARGVFNYDVGLMPYRRSINIVVGRPVKVVQSSKPSPEEVDRVHSEYIGELQRLWDLWKDDFAPHRKGELQIIE
ncbi:hypothetical protein B7463_g11907, partial [Scytalidium lignicola]